MLSEAKDLGFEVDSLASRTPPAALQFRIAQNDIWTEFINCRDDVHFLLFFWLVGFALEGLEFVVCGTSSFCPIFNLRGSSM